MSMSTHVVGIVPPDANFEKMRTIYELCRSQKVPIPREVEKFFNDERPDAAGVRVDLKAVEWSDDSRAGLEIDVATIPPHVKTIRFYNAW